MTAERPEPRPIDERAAPRCGAGPVARWRFVLRELRAWMRGRARP
jgi:hypothetical protein